MSFVSKIKKKFTGAALATTLAVSTALAPSFDANAEVVDQTNRHVELGQSIALSKSYHDQGKNVVIIHQGVLSEAAETMLSDLSKKWSDDNAYKIQRLKGETYKTNNGDIKPLEGVVVIHNGETSHFSSDGVVILKSFRDKIDNIFNKDTTLGSHKVPPPSP